VLYSIERFLSNGKEILWSKRSRRVANLLDFDIQIVQRHWWMRIVLVFVEILPEAARADRPTFDG
jgi:hypothetical protein